MMEFAQGLIEFFNCLLEVLIAVFFFRAFQEPRYSRKRMIAIAAAIIALFILSRLFLKNSVLVMISTTLLTILLAMSYEFKWYQAVFSALALSAISSASEILVALLFEAANWQYDRTISSAMLNVICILLSKSVSVLITLLIYKRQKRAFSHIKTTTFAQFMTLPFSTALIIIVFGYLFFANAVLPKWLLIISIIAILFLISSIVLVFYLLDRQEEFRAMEERLRQVDLLLQAQKEYYDELYNSQQEIRRSRHDQKNLLIAILAELDRNDLPKLRQMINSRLDRLDRVLLTNPKDSVLESILYIKQQSAKKRGIQIESEISLTRIPVVDELDLGVMLSNLIDNAVESLVRDRVRDTIRCTIRENGDDLLLTVENRVYHPVNVKRLSTTKADKKRHGLGLPSVQTLAAENDGMVEITCEKGIFVVNVVLPNVN